MDSRQGRAGMTGNRWRWTMAIGMMVNWNGKDYEVAGYATHGGKVYMLWLVGHDKVLHGEQLKDVRWN